MRPLITNTPGAVSNAQLTLDAPQTPCQITINWSGDVSYPSNLSGLPIIDNQFLVMAFSTTVSAVLPIELALVDAGQCSDTNPALSCNFVPLGGSATDDSIWSCDK